MTDDVLVSVCMPTYNQGEFVEEALNSIVCQTYKNIEILVGDSASPDNTAQIVKKVMKKDSRIRYIRYQENTTGFENGNSLIKQARGKYIKGFFSDDICMPTIIEEEVNFLEKNKNLAGVFTVKQDIDKLGRLLPTEVCLSGKEGRQEEVLVDRDLYFKQRLKYNKNVLIITSSLIRKDVLDEFSGFDSRWAQFSDFDLCARILEKYQLGIINKRLIYYRRHDKQDSRYFLRFDREGLNISLVYLLHYFGQEKNADLKDKYGGYLNRLVAEDYLMLALRNIFKGERGEAIKFIKLSQGYFRFFLFSKGWLLQHSGRFVVYIFIRSYLQIKRALVVNVLKRPYVFDV